MLNGERIKELRRSLKIKQKDLAETVNISRGRLSNIERSQGNVSSDTVEKLAEALGTTADYLLGLSDYKNKELINVYFQDSETVMIPVYGSVPAGSPIEALQVDEGYIPISKEMLAGGKQFIGLKVKGDSMYPFYQDGDTVIIELTTDYDNGDDVVVFLGYDYEATLKRIYKKEDYIYLEPINKEYPTKKYSMKDRPQVLGIVRELRRVI